MCVCVCVFDLAVQSEEEAESFDMWEAVTVFIPSL